MKKDVLAGSCIAAFALIAPLGLVVVEATTRPTGQRKTASSVAKTDRPQTKSVTSSAPKTSVLAPVPNVSTLTGDLQLNWVGGTQDTTADVIEPSPSTNLEALDAVVEQATQAAEAADAIAAAEAFEPDAATVEAVEPMPAPATEPETVKESTKVALNAADSEKTSGELVTVESGTTGDVQTFVLPIASGTSGSNRPATQPGTKPAPQTVVRTEKPAAPAKSGAWNPLKKIEIKNERCKVTLVNPPRDIVKPVDNILGRGLSKGVAVLLVRSSEVNSPWWVQSSLPRQGVFFKGQARFGNAKTPDGARFKFLVAYIPADEEIPDIGAQLAELPESWIVSQDFDFIMRR